MRVVISDRNVAFAESLAHVLAARGAAVVAVVQRLTEAAVVVSRQRADLCVAAVSGTVDLAAEQGTALRTLADRLPVVLIAESLSPSLRAAGAAAGVRGLAEMHQGMTDLLHLIDRVTGGETVLDTVGRHPPRPPAPGHDAQRLAAFLSKRERMVLAALVLGDDTATIGRTLGISRTTTRGHVQGILVKLGTHSRVGAVTIAVRAKLVDPQTGAWLVP